MKNVVNNLMKRIIFIVSMCLLIIGFCEDCYAANATIKMSSNKKEVEVEEVIEVCIDIESEIDITEVRASIIYDTSMLELVTSSQTITETNGYLDLKDVTEDGKLRTYIIEFKALRNGITQVDFADAPVIIGSDKNKVTAGYTSVYIEVNGEEDKEDELEKLRISPGKLNKKFSPDLFEYSMSVDNDITDVVINAKAKSDRATIKITGDEELKVGTTKVKVIVEAEAGNKKEYIIKVKRLSKDEQKAKDKANKIAERKKRVAIYEDENVIYMENDAQFEVLEIKESDAMKIPIDYKKIKLDLYGIEVDACVLESEKENDIILIYAKNTENGHKGYYSYDKVEKTIQRYFGDTLSIAGDKSKELFEKQEYEDNIRKLSIIIGFAVVLFIVAVIIIIKLSSDIKNIKNDNYLI